MKISHPKVDELRALVKSRTLKTGLTKEEQQDVERWERLCGELGYDVLPTPWIDRDGGRESTVHEGMSGDCVARAICLAGRLDYMQVHDAIDEFVEARETRGRGSRKGKGSSAEDGIARSTLHAFIHYALGWPYTHKRCRLNPEDLPTDHIVCLLDKHVCAMIDNVVLDNFDPSQQGHRTVYGFWTVK